MNVIEAGFERFIEHVRIVILELLGSLNGNEIVKAASYAIYFIFIITIEPIAVLIRWIFNF